MTLKELPDSDRRKSCKYLTLSSNAFLFFIFLVSLACNLIIILEYIFQLAFLDTLPRPFGTIETKLSVERREEELLT